MVTCLCDALSCHTGGARASGVRTGICTWAVTQIGVGKRCECRDVMTCLFWCSVFKNEIYQCFIKK
jgi:hypothetical protein